MNPWRRYRDFKQGEFVLAFADCSWGGADYTAVQIMSYDRIDVPLIYHQQGLASDMTPLLHNELERIYDITGVTPVVSYERQMGGIAELERLNKLNRLGKYRIYTQYSGEGTTDLTETDSKMGHDTTSATRPVMLSQLKDAIDSQSIKLYDKPTISELFSFIVKQMPGGSWKPQAEQGSHDDLVMSLAGVWQMYQTERPPENNNDVSQYMQENYQFNVI